MWLFRPLRYGGILVAVGVVLYLYTIRLDLGSRSARRDVVLAILIILGGGVWMVLHWLVLFVLKARKKERKETRVAEKRN